MRKLPGNIYRASTDDGGFVLMQYLGEHPLMGDCVLCCKSRDGVDFLIEKGHIFFYPLNLNVRNGNIVYCQNAKPYLPLPSAIRRPFVFDKKVQYWFIDDDQGTRRVDRLSQAESKLPIGVAVSHVVLKEIYEGVRWFLFEEVDAAFHLRGSEPP